MQVAYSNYDIATRRSTVVLATLDGERELVLDRPGWFVGQVEWSPSGDALAFTATTEPLFSSALYRLDVATGDVARLSPETSARTGPVAWSTDGSQLAYTVGSDVHIVGRDGSTDRLVARGSDYAGGPDFVCGAQQPPPRLAVTSWTPDDTQLVLSAIESCFEYANFDIAVVDVDGTGLHELFEAGNEEEPTLSPDGNQIAFNGLNVIDRDGSGLHTVAPGGQAPAWSRGGDLAFTQAVYDANGQVADRDVWVADPTPRRLAADPWSAGLPKWSADAAVVGYVGMREDGTRLLALPVEGGTPTVVSAPGETNVSGFDFRPLADNAMEPAARLAGDDRYATAAAIARMVQQQRTTPSRVAVLARGDDFPDGLSAANLGTLPLLLTPRDSLHPATTAALHDLGVDTVIILGGTGAVGAIVEQDLRQAGYSVERRAGNTRYETAVATFEAARSGGIGILGGLHTVIIVSGENFPDALAAGPLAAREHLPILLTGRAQLPSAAAAALARCDNCQQALIIGGNEAIAPTVEIELRAHGLTVRRLSGSTRQATAAAVATLATDELGWSPTHVAIARGDAYPDALVAAPLGALMQAPILLATSTITLGTPGRRFIYSHRNTVVRILALGDTTAVSTAAELEARRTAA